MSGDTAPHVVEDYRGIIQILSHGTIIRSDPAVLGSPESFPDVPGVQWEDVVYATEHGGKLRVYRPAASAAAEKLPVIVYFHSGGFCLGTFEQPNFHSGCLRLASELPAVVLAADYRLAPEHRLPAALDDGAAALSWLRGQALHGAGAHLWLAESADFTKVFVAGESSGANIAHHVAVRHGSGQLALDPLLVSGHVLVTPFFGGAERTATEAEPPAGGWFTLEASDKMWRLSLPAGATRDYPVANPFGPDSPSLEPVAFPPVPPARHPPRPRAALHGEAEGDGEAGGARSPRGGATRVLFPRTMGRGSQRAHPSRKALRSQKQRCRRAHLGTDGS
ncbi:hypothetical protein EJB05_31431, partial [Eragrostis curvula]